MERRDGRTPNELFLYHRLEIPLVERNLKHFAITVGNELYHPSNQEEMFSDVENIIQKLEAIQERTFKVVRL
eukprot:snap_masked-scaffold_14-processed-gene-10.28-mRNA-1 protein AED:1.00 eAED:1.00 QI:0/-1/0/0/-1/1/1/0/71